MRGGAHKATNMRALRMKAALFAVTASDLFDSPLLTITLCALPYMPAAKH